MLGQADQFESRTNPRKRNFVRVRIFIFLSLVGAGNDPASKITDTLAFTRVPAGNRF